jgi:hypothetical protein
MATRSANQKIKVFAPGGGMQVLRSTSIEVAERQELQGYLRREYCPSTGVLLGFRVIGHEARRVDMDLKSTPAPVSITSSEMSLNVERSRTYGMREEERLSRIKNGRAPEDKIERVKAKVRVYAIIGPGKQDILRVWPK